MPPTIFPRFFGTNLPTPVIQTLYDQTQLTGLEHSVFQHEISGGWEIRSGDAFSTDSTTLGGDVFRPEEEAFFGTRFLAHSHPEGLSVLPSETDLKILAHRARLNPGEVLTHTVFGGDGVRLLFVRVTARWSGEKNRVEFQFRGSESISAAEWEELKELAEKIRGEDVEGARAEAGSKSSWNPTKEEVIQVTQEILTSHLNNDIDQISAGVSFLQHSFPLASGGSVSGNQILSAVARLERPEAKMAKEAVKELGGQAAVIGILKGKYLGLTLTSVDLSSSESIRKVTQEILTGPLKNDLDQISTGPSFCKRSFPLASGGTVSGEKILFAVAKLERPEAKTVVAAVKELGGPAAVIGVLKGKYLGAKRWSDSLEGIREVIQEILTSHLNNNTDQISTGFFFLKRSFPLASGGSVSGYQILFAIARLERPEAKTAVETIQELGGQAAVIGILKGKYLGLTRFSQAASSDLEDFIQKNGLFDLVQLFGDDPSKLAEALTFLKADLFQHQDVSEFVKALVGLKVGRHTEGHGHGGGGGRDEDSRKKYLEAVQKALEAGSAVDLSERHLARQVDLLIRMSRRSFETDPAGLIGELRGRIAQTPNHLPQTAQDFLKSLYERTADHFEQTQRFQIRGLKTLPYAYQREGAHFLASHDRAILADEAGMGKSIQAIAAVETLDLKRVLWVTTASNKESLRGEILEHSRRKPADIAEVISGDPRARAEQIRSLNGERYLLINYETLREIHTKDPGGYAKLTEGLDAVIVDEAQLTDNSEALRTKAIHDIAVQRRWLLTATPYQNKLEQIWSLLNWIDPEKYPDERAFRELYARSTQGLLLLRSELSGVMLRRTKKDTLSFFKSSAEADYEAQLKDGIPRLPRLERIPPEVSGHYELSQEQAELIGRMTADFTGWAAEFNENLPDGAQPIDLTKINPLQKFEMIHKAIYDPEYFGIATPNPIFAAMDRSVANRMKRREKVILWAWNTAMLDEMERRYEKHGVRRIDGTTSGTARETARTDFQENADVMILAANYMSGGVGLTLTAAHADIFVQLPFSFPLLYQASGRKQRLIGINNLRHAKDHVQEEWMVPQFPKGFVDGLEDEGLAAILSHGTLVEQVRRRLEGGEYLYNMVMDGYGNPEDLDKYFRVGLLEGMGLV